MKCNYKIKNIDCVNCAKKIEDYLNKDANISNASINYSTLNISYVTNIENSIYYVNKKIKEIEFPSNFLIAIIKRDTESFVPNGDTKIKEGDTIVFYTK